MATNPIVVHCQFSATHWSELPFHEMAGAGKLARASITHLHRGELGASGTLEYLLAYPASSDREVLFLGYERIVGSVGARHGSFVLRHDGVYSATAGVQGRLEIVAQSGSGDFAGISGHGTITARAGEHGGAYHLTLALPG